MPSVLHVHMRDQSIQLAEPPHDQLYPFIIVNNESFYGNKSLLINNLIGQLHLNLDILQILSPSDSQLSLFGFLQVGITQLRHYYIKYLLYYFCNLFHNGFFILATGLVHQIGNMNISEDKERMGVNDCQAEEQDKAFIQVQPLHTLNKNSKTTTASKKRKTKRSPKKNKLSLIDKLLIISSITLGVCAFVGNWFVSMHQNRIIKQVMQRKMKEEIDTNKFFHIYNRTVQIKQNQKYNVQYLYEEEVKKSVQYLSQQKCEQYQQTPMEFQVKQQQQQHQQIQQDGHQQLQHEQQQQLEKQAEQKRQKQIENVQKVNQQNRATQKKQKQFHSISGITMQKLQSAQKYKTLIKIAPWQHNLLCQQQYIYYDSTYRIGSYDTQLPFCIVVPTFNNEPEERYKKNINSIIQQNYTNYHVVIIDDASTDRTGALLEQYSLYLKQQWSKRNKSITIDIYHNEKQLRAMPNLRKAAMSYCKPEEIYVVVDGDDYLLGRQVLKLFNSQFQQHNSWFVYSNFISFTGTIGYSRKHKQQVIQQNRYRKANFATSHLRAFYTSLFQLIKEEDLKDDNGEYFRAANDVAICIPILQMSHRRLHYIPQITYLYNSNTGLNNHIVRIREQIDNSKTIRKRRKYQALQQLPK